MKILKASAKNFASYKHIDFDFNDIGLTLLYGPTGSGKSTLQDLVCWTLYGKTAKKGKVDEVLSWTNPNRPTEAHLSVDLGKEVIVVSRIRGTSHENDLYWLEASNCEPKRGKDIKETQLLLENKLRVSFDLYMATSYYCEFSDSSSFFIDTQAKQRLLLENIVNLSLPVKLERNLKDAKGKTKKELDKKLEQFNRLSGRLEQLQLSNENIKRESANFDKNRTEEAEKLTQHIKKFDEEQAKKIAFIQSEIELNKKLQSLLSFDPCPTCGHQKVTAEYNRIDKSILRLKTQLMQVSSAVNPYIRELKVVNDKINNISILLDNTINDIQLAQKNLAESNKEIMDIKSKLHQFEILLESSYALRELLVQNSIYTIENKTNAYLDKYFDGEFKIEILPQLKIYKNGYECAYTQLSKGQRSLLKLCFTVSFMQEAANNAGIHFDNLFFDEALDGLDSELKLKAFNLFQSLSVNHSSILVIDHAIELQSMFDKRFEVKLIADSSEIYEQS